MYGANLRRFIVYKHALIIHDAMKRCCRFFSCNPVMDSKHIHEYLEFNQPYKGIFQNPFEINWI